MFNYSMKFENKCGKNYRINHMMFSKFKTKASVHLFATSFFILGELEPSKICNDFVFLFLALHASFNNSSSLLFSSSTFGFTVSSILVSSISSLITFRIHSTIVKNEIQLQYFKSFNLQVCVYFLNHELIKSV